MGRAIRSAAINVSRTSKSSVTKRIHQTVLKSNTKKDRTQARRPDGKHKSLRSALSDKTNEGCKLPSSMSTTMTLRKAANKSYAESSSSSFENTFNNGAIHSPRSNALGTSKFSRQNISVEKVSSKNSMLESINEVITSSPQFKDEVSHIKKPCVYTNSELCDLKQVTNMLPDEKMKLYEFEVDINEPKQVKKKRKHRKRKVAVADFSDNESSSVGSVSLKLSGLSTKASPLENDAGHGPGKKRRLHFLKAFHNKENEIISTTEDSTPMQSPTVVVLVSDKEPLPVITPSLSASTPPYLKCASNKKTTPTEQPNMLTSRLSKDQENVTTLTASSPDHSDQENVMTASAPDHSPIAPTDTRCIFSPSQKACSTPCSFDSNSSGSFQTDLCKSLESQDNVVVQPFKRDNITLRRKALSNIMPENISLSANCSPISVPRKDCTSYRFNNVTQRRKILCSTAIEDSDSETLPRMNSSAHSLQDYVTRRRNVHHRSDGHQPQSSAYLDQVLTVDNCFGFDGSESEDDAPIQSSVKPKRWTPGKASRPVRLSFRKRKAATPNLSKSSMPPASTSDESTSDTIIPTPVSNSTLPCTSDSIVAANGSPSLLFADQNNLSPVLFVDNSEDSYFQQPPRRSYERVPHRKRYFTADEEEPQSEDEAPPSVAIPKKKPKVYKKKETKADKDWFAAISSQFAEIENSKLLVE